MRRATGFVLAGLSAVLLNACSQVVSSSIATAPHLQPAAEPANVQILGDAPDQPYIAVGTIRVRWWGVRDESSVRHDPAIQAALRAEAAKLGANAVIELALLPALTGRADDWRQSHALFEGVTATAVRLKTGLPSASHSAD